MRAHSLPDHAVLPALAAIVARDRNTTVEMLDHISVADSRGLYLAEGLRSMFDYCVRVLRMSEDIAYKRIRAARAARDFPAIFYMIADGRLNLSAVVLLAPYLKIVDEPQELLAGATNKTNKQIECMLAERFPQPDIPTRIRPIESSEKQPPVRASDVVPALLGAPTVDTSGNQLAARPVLFRDTQHVCQERVATSAVDANTVDVLPRVPEVAQAPAPPPRVAPLSPERFALQLTMSQEMHDALRLAQDLLSHQIPSGNVVEVLHYALKCAIREQQKRKYAATSKPRPSGPNASANPRHIPAYVKRAVRTRDGEQCTYVSEAGRRCSTHRFLEYDHIEPVARGGLATIENLRLRCRAHNQHDAERVFGFEFMNSKREQARLASA